MTERAILSGARKHVVPLVWGAVLLIAALVFHDKLFAWFGSDDVGGTKSAGLVLTAGDVAIEVALQPDPPVEKGNSLRVTLRDKEGNGISKADVRVLVKMPAMGSMSEMRRAAEVSERGNGAYRATFDLAMGGTWMVVVEADTSLGALSAEYTLTLGTSGLVAIGATVTDGTAKLPAHAFATAAKPELARALAAYEVMRASLAADFIDGLAEQGSLAAQALRAAKTADSDIPAAVGTHLSQAASAADAVATAGDIVAARGAFARLSKHLVAATSVDPTVVTEVHAFECPMTHGYNKWLQTGTSVSNPYQGTQMLTCGAEIELAAAVPDGAVHADVHDPNDIAHYTCPMDTWVKQTGPGRCPVCGMDLVPVTVEEVRTGVMRIDHRRRQLIGLTTGMVQRRDMNLQVRAVGRVAYDETRLAEVTLKYDGWIETLEVEETGTYVRRGQTLFTVYSPELYTAQQEYLLALSQQELAQDDAGRRRADVLVRGARRRLELFDVSDRQLAKIAEGGAPLQYVPVPAPASGYVVAKDVIQGGAIVRGQRLFRIAALDRVWVEAEVYEQDMALVKVGQVAKVTLSHLPGRTFEGKVTFIYPYLDSAARTARARIELANKDLELKPDMYANVTLAVPRGERLVVPESAVIYSGPRRIVFLDMKGDQLRPVAIEVGLESDGYFEVLSGLEQGDRVVTSGNFLLSAESRLKAATGLW